MSNIYIQEPPTSGKVLLTTSCGDIDIELWSKETPRACRNFVQLCLEGYYNNTIFHRVVKDFIVQGGDPTGTGEGGESVYGKPFKDEFHSRLRFVRRGLVAMANAGPHDNGSQFFFTLGATPELNNKHTIFGKVVGNTIFNMLKLLECEIDGNDRPLYPYSIKATKVLANPYDDIIPRILPKQAKPEDQKKKKSKSKATKNFSLLSFGEEAEEDEEEVNKATESMRHKSKSAHDTLEDSKLSSVPAVEMEAEEKSKKKKKRESEGESDSEEALQAMAKMIRKKLKKEEEDTKKEETKKEKEKEVKKETPNIEKYRQEAKQLKKEMQAAKLKKEETPMVEETEQKEEEEEEQHDMVSQFMAEKKKFKEQKKSQKKKGSDRESQTLALLAKFQTKLHAATRMQEYASDEEEEKEEVEEDTDNDHSWMAHKLKFEEGKGKVLDANVHDTERYEIFDPRNPLTQRRREASKQAMKGKR